MNISKSVKIACAMKVINQTEAAEAMGFSQAQLSRIVRFNNCTTETLKKLAAGLNYSVSEFIALGEEKAA